jgi:hypothetical protein
MNLLERLAEIKRIWNGEKREVRYTAVGWKPGEGWKEDCQPTPSGEREFYTVVREAPNKKRRNNEQKHFTNF